MIEFIPMVLTVIVLAGYKDQDPFCVKKKECFGNVIMAASSVATFFEMAKKKIACWKCFMGITFFKHFNNKIFLT